MRYAIQFWRTHNPAGEGGFTLPVILVISITLLIFGLSMMQTSSSVRSSINSQYYNRLATEAAQAGLSYASYCLVHNSYIQEWGQAAGQPNLTQSTTCTGTDLSPAIPSLISATGLSSTFSVGDVEGRDDGATIITSIGTVTQYRGNTSQVAQTYAVTAKQVIRPPDLHLGNVVMGYYIYNGDGAFFATLANDGKFHTAGVNDFGQLGNGTTTNALQPQVFELPVGVVAQRAYTNFLSHGWQLFVQTTQGELYGAGMGSSGQLGNGSILTNNPTPQKFQLPAGEKVLSVESLGTDTYVVTDKNNVYSAGDCSSGLLGNGSSNCGKVSTPARVLLPTPVLTDPNTLPGTQMVSDRANAYIIMKGGRVYGWGDNSWGELGDGTTTGTNIPKKIGTFGDAGQPQAVQIAFDGDTFYILDSNGDAWATGRNTWGEAGFSPTTDHYTTLQKIPLPPSAGKVVQITTDQWFTSLRTSSGDVYSVGTNDRGQLGNGATSSNTSSPVKFILPNGIKASYIYTASVGDSFSRNMNNTFVIGSNGKVYGAGSDVYGQLGDGKNTATVSTPATMQVFDGSQLRAAQVVTGYGTTIVLSDTGKIYSMGHNNYGQLGIGTTTNTNVPTMATFLQSQAPSYIF